MDQKRMIPLTESESESSKNLVFAAGIFVAIATAVVCMPDLAVAGAAAGGPLDDVYTNLTSWSQGSVGKTLTIGMVLVGVAAGIVRQSLMAFAVGIGGGLGLYNSPTIVDTIFTATI